MLGSSCTTYYDFLTSERQLDCGKKQQQQQQQFDDNPIISDREKCIPMPTLRNFIKYFDVDDKAIDWYKSIKKDSKTPKVCKKRFCFKFRAPIRHAANRIMRPEMAFCQSRRISPEFLCLLQKHQQMMAKRSPIYQVPGKMLTGKPSFSYYKYKGDAKNRHMRPGIDTAAPIEFPCNNKACPRRTLTPEEIERLGCKKLRCCNKPKGMIPLDLEADVNPYCHYLLAPKGKYRKSVLLDPKGKNLFLKENACLADLNAEREEEQTPRLHEIYEPNYDSKNEEKLPSERTPRKLHLLYDTNSGATQVKFEDSRPKLHQIYVTSRNVIPKKPLKKVSQIPDMTDYCSVPKPKPCGQSLCSNRNCKSRDPRSIEYENRPYYKVLLASDRNRRRPCRGRSRSCSRSTSRATTEDDAWDWTKSLEQEYRQEQAENECTGYRVRPDDPPHRFYDQIADSPHHVLVRRSRRPNLYDQNDVEMPPKHKANNCGYGFTGFIHHSEKQNIQDPCCKRKKKPPPYCYFWSAVDPDIRHEERTRLAERDCRNREKCETKAPHTYYWSNVPHNTRREVKKRLSENQVSVVKKQKRCAPLFWSTEAQLPIEKKKKSSTRLCKLPKSDPDDVSNSSFKENHSKHYGNSSFLWSTDKQTERIKTKKKSTKHKVSDSSSGCACSGAERDQDDTEIHSFYLSTRPQKCQSNEPKGKRWRKPTMNRKVYNSDRESEKGHMKPNQRQRLINPNNGEDRLGDDGSGGRIVKKPRIFPNLHAMFKHFLWPSKKSRKYDTNYLTENERSKSSKTSTCIKTQRGDTGPCVRKPEDSQEDSDNLDHLSVDERSLRRQHQKTLGMERIQKQSPERKGSKAESSTSQCGQRTGPRDPNFWSGRKVKRERSTSSTVTKRRRESRTGMTAKQGAKQESTIRERRRSVTPLSMDTEPECCRKTHRIRRRKCRRTITYPTTAVTTCGEEPHRESYTFRNRPIQYRNYMGPEPKLNTRYGYQRNLSRTRSPCFARSVSPQIRRRRVSISRRKRCPLPRPSSHTSLASDGYRSPTYSKREYPCLAAHQKESRAQREWEERQYRKKKRVIPHLTDVRSNDWLLTSRAADEVRPKKCRRSLVLTEQSKQFPNKPNYWHMVQPTKDSKHKRKGYHVVQPSNVDNDSYMELDNKCGKKPDMLYLRRAEETISDGDEDDRSIEGCDYADHLKVSQIYDYKVSCSNPQLKEQKSKKMTNENDDRVPGSCKRCSRRSRRIRGGEVPHHQREKPHSFAFSLSSYHSQWRMHYHEVIDNKNTNWTHNFCF